VKRAIKDGFKGKPAKGKKYLKDCNIGEIVETSLSTAILIEITQSSCSVIVVEWRGNKEDTSSYLGKTTWASTTEVTIKEEI